MVPGHARALGPLPGLPGGRARGVRRDGQARKGAVATAERLGSDQWMPVVALAQTALAAGRRDLALGVFAAANRPGLQQDYLAARCLELTGQPPPRRHLRAVQ